MSDEDSSQSSESCVASRCSKSKFDEYFEIIPESEMALCKLCPISKKKKVEIKMKNRNTSGLRKHLLSCHEKESQKLIPIRKPTTIRDISSFFNTTGRSEQVR